jgi:hypothetical protein
MQRVPFCHRCGTYPRAYATTSPTIPELIAQGWQLGPTGAFMVCADCLRYPHVRRWLMTTERLRMPLSAQPN